jgi:hypothetical protein
VLRAVLSSVTAPPETPAPKVASVPEPRAPWWRRVDHTRLYPLLATLAGAVVFAILQPRTVDLAAHTFRADLFGREGFTIWNGEWYGGHHTVAYSIFSPALGWLLTPIGALVAASLACTALFEPLARRHFGDRAGFLGALWFGVASITLMFTSRLPFAIGIGIGLASLLALQRGRLKTAVALAFLCPLGSPISGLFLTLAALAYGLAARGEEARRQRRVAAAISIAAMVPPVFLAVAFPEGGYAPFPWDSYTQIPFLCVALLLLLPLRERAIRWGAALYLAGGTLAFLIETPMGVNAVRLGALFGGPLLLAAVLRSPPRRVVWLALLPVFAALAFWQWSPAVRDFYKAVDDPAAEKKYFEPLKQYLATLPDQRRIEIPFTKSHWENAEVAGIVPLARGWLRQLDTGRHPVFYKGPLNEVTYASWLSENAVRYVALPSAKPDSSTYKERALIERGLPYLKLRWSSKDWRVFEVTLPAPFVIPRGHANITLEQLGSDRVLLRVLRPGQALVRVRWTPYWFAHGGCVEREGEWTKVTALREGFLELTTRFSPERIWDRGRRCDDSVAGG